MKTFILRGSLMFFGAIATILLLYALWYAPLDQAPARPRHSERDNSTSSKPSQTHKEETEIKVPTDPWVTGKAEVRIE